MKKRHSVGKSRKRRVPQPDMSWLFGPNSYSPSSEDIRSRAARTLGWSEADARSLSLASIRDLVRPADPSLAREIDDRIASGKVLL